MGLVKETLNYSLYAQFIALIVGSLGFLFTLKPQDKILKEILGIETIVQIVEATFYIWFSFFYNKNLDKNDITKYRYYDWVITTPIMLLSTIMYFEYNNTRKSKEIFTLETFMKKYKDDILQIFLYNFAMLLMGYLQEIKKISLSISLPLGFIFFGLNFRLIYERFVKQSPENIPIFNILLVLWGLYGIASACNLVIKNSAYNILDIFSKNFYGIFICYIIYKNRIL